MCPGVLSLYSKLSSLHSHYIVSSDGFIYLAGSPVWHQWAGGDGSHVLLEFTHLGTQVRKLQPSAPDPGHNSPECGWRSPGPPPPTVSCSQQWEGDLDLGVPSWRWKPSGPTGLWRGDHTEKPPTEGKDNGGLMQPDPGHPHFLLNTGRWCLLVHIKAYIKLHVSINMHYL